MDDGFEEDIIQKEIFGKGRYDRAKNIEEGQVGQNDFEKKDFQNKSNKVGGQINI